MTDEDYVAEHIRKALPPNDEVIKTLDEALSNLRATPLRLAVDVTVSPDDPTLFLVKMAIPACWLREEPSAPEPPPAPAGSP